MIWTITTTGIFDRKLARKRRSETRCWGFAFSKEDAISNLEWCDDECGSFTHAVIERMEPGLPCHVAEECWFRWDGDESDGKWVPCDKPESEAMIVNYGIG